MVRLLYEEEEEEVWSSYFLALALIAVDDSSLDRLSHSFHIECQRSNCLESQTKSGTPERLLGRVPTGRSRRL